MLNTLLNIFQRENGMHLILLFFLNLFLFNYQYRGIYDDEPVKQKKVKTKSKSPGLTEKDILEQCDKVLGSLDLCRNPNKTDLKKFKDLVKHDEWADLRLLGAYMWMDQDDQEIPLHKVEIYGHLPSFTLTAFNFAEEDDGFNTMFIATHRLSQLPMGFVPTGPGYAFEVIAVYASDKTTFKFNYFVTICEKTGVVSLTKELVEETVHIRARKGGGYTSVRNKFARIRDPIQNLPRKGGLTAAEINPAFKSGATVVCVGLNTYAQQSLNLTVQATDKRGKVNLIIPMHEAKDIFKGRIKVESRTGRARPIFHWVTSHKRSNGQFVRTHTRGLQSFQWKGMDINIILPGRDKPLLHKLQCIIDVKGSFIMDFLNKRKPFKVTTELESVDLLPVEEGDDVRGVYY